MTGAFNPAKFFILGFEGLNLSDDFSRFIRDNPPAGFLLLGHNFESLDQLRSLTSSLKSLCGEKTILAADQEPGRVQRFKGEFPLSKKPSYYLKQTNMSEFRAWCSETADTMASAGLNMNFAPVIDLYPVSGDFQVLNQRSFGDDFTKVSEFAAALIEEFGHRKIFTCAKHFPGLGAGIGDPHETLTRSEQPLERFLDYHWKPFKSAVQYGVDCIMTTHLSAAALDSENCATYSKNAISHLRNTIGFRGPIISDDLYMAGAKIYDSLGMASEASLLAGHNLLIISKNIELQAQVMEFMQKRYDEDTTFRQLWLANEQAVDRFKSGI